MVILRSYRYCAQNPLKTSHLIPNHNQNSFNDHLSPPTSYYLFSFQSVVSAHSLYCKHSGFQPQGLSTCCSCCLEYSSSSFPDFLLSPQSRLKCNLLIKFKPLTLLIKFKPLEKLYLISHFFSFTLTIIKHSTYFIFFSHTQPLEMEGSKKA